MTDWREVYENLDPSENLYNEWQRLAPESNYNTFRKMLGAQGGKRGKILQLPRGVLTETADGAMVSSSSTRITTLEALLEVCKVDLQLWQVDRFEITKREVQRKDIIRDLQFDDGRVTGTLSDSGMLNIEPLVNLRAWLKRREEAPLDIAVDRIIDRLRDHAPAYKPPRALKPAGEYLLVPAIFDAHFNRRSVDGLYTVEQAKTDFMEASEALAARTVAMGYPIKRILIPAGNDGLHADNLHGTTSGGTQVEMAGAQGRAIDALCEAYTHLIELMATIAPVDVIAVPGNHDRYSTKWLGRVLSAQFSRHPNVAVNTECAPRTYYQFGKTLIGLTHGDKAGADKLGQLMAHEARQAWADTDFQEWLLGHWHNKKGMRQYVTEVYGVNVRVFPALCPADEWHSLMGFIGAHRAATGMLYHEQYGPAAEFPVFINEVETARPALAIAA